MLFIISAIAGIFRKKGSNMTKKHWIVLRQNRMIPIKPFIHYSENEAIKEALRLSAKEKDKFFVFEITHLAFPVKEPVMLERIV
jgi:hypothetical protein